MSEGRDRWSSGAFPPCVVILLDQPEIGMEWKSWLTFELALRGVLLDIEGDIMQDGVMIGSFRFLELEQTEVLLQTMNIDVQASSCPWGGAIRGALGWIQAANPDELLRDFLPLLAQRCRGPFVNTDSGVVFEPLRKVTFPLSNLLGKHGFDDGDALLSRDPDYLEYARREAEAALAQAGMVAGVGAIETHHNPLRIWGPIRRLDQWEEVRDWELGRPSMIIWAYDDSFLREVAFW